MCCACGGGEEEGEDDTGDDGTGGDGEGDTGGDEEEEDDNTGGDGDAGTCVDTNFNSAGEMIGDSANDYCDEYTTNPGWCGNYDTAEFDSVAMCCACGGGETGGDDGAGGDGDAGTCTDTQNVDAAGERIGDSYGDHCEEYLDNTNWCGNYDTEEFISGEMCCACGGGSSGEADEGEDDSTEGDEGDDQGDGD